MGQASDERGKSGYSVRTVFDPVNALHHGYRGFGHGNVGMCNGRTSDAGDLQGFLFDLLAGPDAGETTLPFDG